MVKVIGIRRNLNRTPMTPSADQFESEECLRRQTHRQAPTNVLSPDSHRSSLANIVIFGREPVGVAHKRCKTPFELLLPKVAWCKDKVTFVENIDRRRPFFADPALRYLPL